MRTVGWFSCGATSAVAIKQQLEINPDMLIVRIYIADEDDDNNRFAKDCERWYGKEIITLKNEKYNGSVDQVIKDTKYLSGVLGAPCTKKLKKEVRLEFQKDDDQHVFGFNAGEEVRVNRLHDSEPELKVLTPLIDKGLTKKDCFNILMEAGIALPRMYTLGFPNANCRGCVKGVSAGYWNLTRKHYPKTFEIRSKQEQLLNAKLWKMSARKYKKLFPEMWDKMNKEEPGCYMIDASGTLRLPLRYLPEDYYGTMKIEIPDCGILCQINEEN